MIVVVLLAVVGLVGSLYTRQGSGISDHPQDAGSAPGTSGGSETSGKDQGEGSPLDGHGMK